MGKWHRMLPILLAVAATTVSPGVLAQSADEVSQLRRELAARESELERQRAELARQQAELERQAAELDRLSNRLGAMEEAGRADASVVAAAPAATAAAIPRQQPIDMRDSVGDANAESVRAGTFPGSFRIPGTRDVSLAIGGFVKTEILVDSNAEAMGADFLPSALGTLRPDTHGATSIDATLTRLFLDGRAPLPDGSLRGYVEYDLNGGNNGVLDVKLRHAYGAWTNPYGTLTVGQTWSTLMDPKVLPEGLTEPTVSGAIFVRQAQVRWTQRLDSRWMYHVALEDPSSNDHSTSANGVVGQTTWPDMIAGIEYDTGGDGHVRLNGILRRLEVDGAVKDAATAWGLVLTGRVNFSSRDNFRAGVEYGKGLGRYLLGIQSSAGAAAEPATGLQLRDNWGGFATYQHFWSDTLRSTLMGGYARSEPLDWQPGSTFQSTTYGAINLMWSPYPYLTVGIEYGYGNFERQDGTGPDNHRIGVGVQVF